MKAIVVGGGWAGCAAALAARKQGVETVLLERTDMLLGTGLVGGIMRNNGRFSATEELIAMSGGELFQIIDAHLLHTNIEFPGHRHASLYNIAVMEPVIKSYLQEQGVEIQLESRVSDVVMDDRCITGIKGKTGREPFELSGDVFIDTTGTAGGPAICNKYGNGCAMCVLRCHAFGARVSLAAKAGVTEVVGHKGEQYGAFSGSCKLLKESLAPELLKTLNETGVAVLPIPEAIRRQGKLGLKACQQYALAAFEENIILLDTGHAKLMAPFFPLEALRQIPGLEQARYEDPYAGGLGNSIRFVAMAPRDEALKVDGVDNLYCAGEKAGLLVGHTEAICTGTLAGWNAACTGLGRPPLVLPDSLALGYAIRYVQSQMQDEENLGQKFTFSGSVLFERLQEQGLYTTDIQAIRQRVERAGLIDVFTP